MTVLKSIYLELYLGYPLDVNRTFAAPDYPIGKASEKQRSLRRSSRDDDERTQSPGLRRLVELRRNDPASCRFARCFTSCAMTMMRREGRGMSVTNGLYSIHIEMTEGGRGHATGIIVLLDGKIAGGDFALLLLRHLHCRTRQMARRIDLQRACQIGRRIAAVRRA